MMLSNYLNVSHHELVGMQSNGYVFVSPGRKKVLWREKVERGIQKLQKFQRHANQNRFWHVVDEI